MILKRKNRKEAQASQKKRKKTTLLGPERCGSVLLLVWNMKYSSYPKNKIKHSSYSEKGEILNTSSFIAILTSLE